MENPDEFPPDLATRARARTFGGWARYLGATIAVVGLAFALYAVYLARKELTFAEVNLPVMGAAVLVGVTGMLCIGLNWIRIMQNLGSGGDFGRALSWYFVGQLGKYIPGGLWAVMGRSELAARGGVARSVAYSSVAMGLITTYAAAAATGAVFIGIGSDDVSGRLLWIVGSVAIVGLTMFGLSEMVVGRVNRMLERFGFGRNLPSASSRLSGTAILLTMPAWVLIGLATAVCAAAIGVDTDIGSVIAATSYSWLAGFLVLPLPGGLGVREATFIALWQGATAEAAAIAVAARLTFVVADLLGAGASTLAVRLTARMRGVSESR